MKLIEHKIEDEILVCPYCGTGVSEESLGCCGESSAHFETAYEYDGDIVLESEVTEIVKGPILSYIWHKITGRYYWLKFRVWKTKFRVKRAFEFFYKCQVRPGLKALDDKILNLINETRG
jgi:hypothetical protein